MAFAECEGIFGRVASGDDAARGADIATLNGIDASTRAHHGLISACAAAVRRAGSVAARPTSEIILRSSAAGSGQVGVRASERGQRALPEAACAPEAALALLTIESSFLPAGRGWRARSVRRQMLCARGLTTLAKPVRVVHLCAVGQLDTRLLRVHFLFPIRMDWKHLVRRFRLPIRLRGARRHMTMSERSPPGMK